MSSAFVFGMLEALMGVRILHMHRASLECRPRPRDSEAVLSCSPRFRWKTQMDEQRKYAILFAATILAARKLNEIGVKPCPARECAIADAVENAKREAIHLRKGTAGIRGGAADSRELAARSGGTNGWME
jgi:hypothetical protein